MKKVKVILTTANMARYYWGEVLSYAAELYNRTESSATKKQAAQFEPLLAVVY